MVVIRSILSIVSLIIIVASLVVIVPLMILPNTFLHQVIPILAPLHQALACSDGETIRYETTSYQDGYDTYYRCVDAVGSERNVDDILRRPAIISMGTLCFGVLLMLIPLYMTVRAGANSQSSEELQTALRQSVTQMEQSFREGGQATVAAAPPKTHFDEPLSQQLQALDQLLQQGMISQSDYALARRKLLDSLTDRRA